MILLFVRFDEIVEDAEEELDDFVVSSVSRFEVSTAGVFVLLLIISSSSFAELSSSPIILKRANRYSASRCS